MSPVLRESIQRILFAAGVLASTVTMAAEPQPMDGEIAEIVIVTGSYIRGTAEDAALPVDVISTEELEKQGSPSTVEMLKSVTVMNGTIAESNRFTAGRGQAAQGSAAVNLRGFGAERTLTLLNGKRLASEDANLMPANAIARVEILKDGGASTYGSDAIGGVVNFITKERVEGLEVSADYRYIPDSDGDYNTGLAWGTRGDRWDFFVAGNYFHRSQLSAADRDWAVQSFARNPQGGWSTGANPGNFIFRTTTNQPQAPDPGCTFFGGVLASATQCQTQFTQWDNLVEEQDSYQAYTSFGFDVTETVNLKVEALYAFTDVPEAGTTPSYTTTRRISETVLPCPTPLNTVAGACPATGPVFGLSGVNADPRRTSFFYIPSTNPGFQAAVAAAQAGQTGFAPATATSAYIQINQWRPFMAGGNPGFGYGLPDYNFERENSRVSAELTGEIGAVNWVTSATYGWSKVVRTDADIVTGRMQLALLGLGGEGCDPATGTAGVGPCQYFNPFSSAIPTNPFTGQANPNYIASLENSAALARWLQDVHLDTDENSVGELNAVLSGDLPVSLSGGPIGWAFGGQYRKEWIENTNNLVSSNVGNPCPDTPINGDVTCNPQGESPYNFLATNEQLDIDRDVYAVFGEVSLPVTDALSAQVAARFEDYGDQGGSSFDPKLSVRYQVIDELALRGSVSTTFRAAGQQQLLPLEAIAFTQILGSNRPIGITGNPDLEPEEAFTFSVGAIVTLGNFRAMVDYWRYDIEKILQTIPSSGIVNALFPNGATGPNNCGLRPDLEAKYFDFSGPCSANNVIKVKSSVINGGGIVNDGVDVVFDYTFENVFGGSLVVGTSGTWISEYKTEDLVVDGVTVETGFDGVGQLNQGTSLFALPEWRAQAYLDYSLGAHNVRWTTNFIDQYRDQRAALFTATSPDGQVVESNLLHNVTYRTELPGGVVLLGTVENVFDEDPSFARLELNYDPLTGFPLGRTFKLGLRKSF